MPFILQDIKSGMFVRQYSFHLLFWTGEEKKAKRFDDRPDAETFLIEHDREKELAIVPFVKEKIYTHA